MIVKVYFTAEGMVIPFAHQHVLNGIVYGRFFKGDKDIHDGFSPYAVSSIQGCRMVGKEGLFPYEEPYIQFSSDSYSLVTKFIEGVEDEINNGEQVFFGRRIERYITDDFMLGPDFDVVKTISPVLVKDNKNKMVYGDEKWEEKLYEKCVRKIEKCGVVDDSFKIVFGNKDNIKRKLVQVGKCLNPCTSFVATIYGKKRTREILYNMGFGGSTGSGFGSVQIIRK